MEYRKHRKYPMIHLTLKNDISEAWVLSIGETVNEKKDVLVYETGVSDSLEVYDLIWEMDLR